MKIVATAIAVSALSLGMPALAAEPGPAGAERTVSRSDALARAGAMFDRMDANKDSKLDAADRAARREAAFARLDTDKNGQLSQAEFMAQPERRAEGRRMGGGRMMLRMADADRDRTVTRQEFLAAATSRFERMDANRDGSVTPEERRAARAQMRERMRGMTAPTS